MHQIHITYRPAGTTGPARGSIQRTLPERWSELTAAQAWHCIDLLISGRPRREILSYLLDLPVLIEELLEHEVIYDLLRCITWMEIDPLSPEPVVSYIDVGRHRFFLPRPKMEYTTCREYMILDDLYASYVSAHDPAIELQMIALVLRPAGPSPYSDSDPRILLRSDDHPLAWQHQVRELPESARLYILTLITAMRRYVYDTYRDYLFEAPDEHTDQEPHHISDDDDGLNFGWQGAYLDVAADGLFGTYEQVLDARFHDVCVHMVRKVDDARRRRIDADHALIRSRHT